MINVNDFKNGQTINYDGNLYQVLDFNHVKPGKGAAIVKAKLKNDTTDYDLNTILNKSFSYLMLELKYLLLMLKNKRCNFFMLMEITIAS